jgi:hypothetical protein
MVLLNKWGRKTGGAGGSAARTPRSPFYGDVMITFSFTYTIAGFSSRGSSVIYLVVFWHVIEIPKPGFPAAGIIQTCQLS